MRPLRLELVGFKSYDRADVDWSAFDLVVIAGDTGAGKTSLLDAICFALYGKTPETTRTKDLLTVGRRHGEVRLTFRLHRDVWRITRRFGPDAPAPAQVLERSTGEDAWEIVGDDVDARVRALVGLSFDAFTSAVLLAQGRFAQFLAAQPRQRDAILRELFAIVPLDGVRQAAAAFEVQFTGEATGLDSAAASLGRHDPATWNAACRAVRDATVAARRLAHLERRAADVAERTQAADAARQRVQQVRDAAAQVPDPAQVAALAARVEAAEEAVAQRREAHGRARADHDAAQAARQMLALRHDGDAATLAVLHAQAERVATLTAELPGRESAVKDGRTQLDARQKQLDADREAGIALAARHQALVARAGVVDSAAAAAETQARAAQAVQDATAELDRAVAAHDAAVAARTDAQHTVDEGIRLRAAAAVRAGLDAGDACPVCGGTVGDHAPHPDDDDEARATQALHAAQGAERRAATARAQAAAAHEHAHTQLTAAEHTYREAAAAVEAEPDAETDREALQAAVAAATDELEALSQRFQKNQAEHERAEGVWQSERRRLDDDARALAGERATLGAWARREDPVADLDQALQEARAADAATHEAAARLTACADDLRAAEQAVSALVTHEVGELRRTAQRAADAVGAPSPDHASPQAFFAALDDLRAAIETARADAEKAAQHAAAAADEAHTRFADVAAPLGVTSPEAVAAAVRRGREAVPQARVALAAVVQAAHDARTLGRRADDARRRAGLHHQVAEDLKANKFPRHLLGRFRERLATGASARLQELSHGAYRFTGKEPDPLNVVDLRRGEHIRSAATLSGGERFLASLALALGLADIAAESGGRLDCLFLDEGFSTLDADSLEQALGGVERLSGDGRLIAVITHLPGVADRLGARLQVAKDAAGVSRVVDTPTATAAP